MLDVIKLCQEYRVPYLESGHHHCALGWVQLHCPFCAGGRSGWHLGFALERGNFVCWRCGSLKFWDTMHAILRGQTPEQVKRIVHDHQKVGTRTVKVKIERKKDLKLPDDTRPLLKIQRRYLCKRGFDPVRLEADYQLRGVGPLGGVWAWRVLIPVFQKQRMVAYQGRAIRDNVAPKYRMLDDEDCLIPPDSLLYAMDRVVGDTVLIVEGVTGVWRMGDGTTCTFGVNWHPAQANLLRRFTNRFVLFDPEPLAQRRALRLAEYLSPFPGTTEVLSGFRCQPGEFNERQVRRVRKAIGLSY